MTGRRTHFLYTLALGFYSSVPFEVPKLKSGKSALEAESESLDSYMADSDLRWDPPKFSFYSLASGCRAPIPSVFLTSQQVEWNLLSDLVTNLSVALQLLSDHSLQEHANFHRLLCLGGVFLGQQQQMLLSFRNGGMFAFVQSCLSDHLHSFKENLMWRLPSGFSDYNDPEPVALLP